MALRKVKGNLERMFDKNLSDLVRGIRNNKDCEAKYIAQCMDEIKAELRQENFAVKANAVAKLTYLQMLGYDISWAGFNIVEVMSSSKFTYKRIGYLAASQCFHQDTEVVMLTTNMIRKDLNGQNMYDAGTALTGLACFISPEIARDLANDIMTLLSSTRPYIRKKAVLLLYKVFLKYPEALRPAFPRLKEKLEDPDPGVQSAAVNVICELARKNPKNYLSLAPLFFKLMTSSTNNWMLIKIIKLFGALTPLEPRLGKKLIEPLTNLIHSTSAMSLLYECINTVIAGMPNHNASIQLCVQKLRILIEDSDQNLKYLGLLAMGRILGSHPKAVQPHKDLVLACLDDKDESIRIRALDLLYGMVSKKSVMEIVRRLMTHMDRAEGTFYRDELLQKIIQICSHNNYQYITNFEWYISVLVELCRMESSKHGGLIANQLLDVAIRVSSVREFAVGQMALLLENTHLLLGPAAANSSIAEVLFAAAWICGEFSHLLPNPRATLEAILKGRMSTLSGHIQAVLVHNLVKLFVRITSQAEDEDDSEMLTEVSAVMEDRLTAWSSSTDLEVQERAVFALQLIRLVRERHEAGDKLGPQLTLLIAGELNPVAPKAQKKVPVPQGLDLDAWTNSPSSESEASGDENVLACSDLFIRSHAEPNLLSSKHEASDKYPEPTDEELSKRRQARLKEQANNPYYVKASSNRSSARSSPKASLANIDEIPVEAIQLNIPLTIPGMTSLAKYEQVKQVKKHRHKKSKKRSKKNAPESSTDEEELPTPLVVKAGTGEMPEGATLSDHEEHDDRLSDDPHRALDIDLDSPLAPGEVLPVLHHRIPTLSAAKLSANSAEQNKTDTRKSKAKKHSKDKKKSKPKKEKANGEVMNKDAESVPYVNGVEEVASGKHTNDLDIWLSAQESFQKNSVENSAHVDKVSKEQHSKSKGCKKSKKEKGSSRSKQNCEVLVESVMKKSKKKSSSKITTTPGSTMIAEEAVTLEASNQCDNACSNGVDTDTADWLLLHEARNDSLSLRWTGRPLPQSVRQVRLCLTVTADCADIRLTRLHLPDTSDLAITRTDVTSSDFCLGEVLVGSRGYHKQLTVQVEEVTVPHKLRGALYYTVERGSELSLAFKLQLPVLVCMSGAGASKRYFTDLLSSGSLTARSGFSTPSRDVPFHQILCRLCEGGCLSVVERVDDTASLYGSALTGHHVCLLVKRKVDGALVVDGKSSDNTLLANCMDHLRASLQQLP